jgi:hypothetical protein
MLVLEVEGICAGCPDYYTGTIYNRYCNVIGGNNKGVFVGTAMTSQLRYTVDITELSFPNMAFCYAGSCYSDFQCSTIEDGAMCARAFNC